MRTYIHPHILFNPPLTSEHVLSTSLLSHFRPGFWYTVQSSGSGSDIPSRLHSTAGRINNNGIGESMTLYLWAGVLSFGKYRLGF